MLVGGGGAGNPPAGGLAAAWPPSPSPLVAAATAAAAATALRIPPSAHSASNAGNVQLWKLERWILRLAHRLAERCGGSETPRPVNSPRST